MIFISFVLQAKMPKDIERKVYVKLSEKIDNYGERDSELELQKYAYSTIEKMEKETILSKDEFILLKKSMEEIYPYDYVTQYKRLKADLKIYETTKKSLVAQEVEKVEKIKVQNLEAKKIIEKQKEELKIPKNLYLKLKEAAEKRYPENYIEQKRYLEHAAEIYGILN